MTRRFSFPTIPVVITASASLLLILAVIFAGTRIGLSPTICQWVAWGILALGILIILGWLIVRFLRSPRSEQAVDASNSEASEAATAPLNAVAVGDRLDRTVQWLKSSKLAEAGKDPLYELPWYLFAGLSGSGKSTLIVQSGFTFSYTDPKKPVGKSNVGPTESCDIWVANEAVFIDPSGKYFADDSASQSWTKILNQIGQRRKARPADGIILVVDVDSLLGLDHNALRLQAERTRSFLDMAAKSFGMVLPIYLLFNKADAIEGFEEFLGDDESTPFGTTFRQEQYRNPHPEEEFKASFDEIHRSLLAHRNSVLAVNIGRAQEKAFSFPSQFPLMKKQLGEFIEVLFQLNQFREQPLFRGFYFASSLQAGCQRSPIAEMMASKAGLPRFANEVRPPQAKNYFIHSLFKSVIIPDRGLAGLSHEVRRRRMRLRVAALGFAGIVLPICLIAFAWGSYQDSHGLKDSTSVAQGIPIRDGKTAETLSMLLDLQQRLESFDCRKSTNKCTTQGRRFFWGLYPSQDALNTARSVYLEKIKALFLSPLFNADIRLGQKYNGLKTQLDLLSASGETGSVGQSAQAFDPGKAYSLLKAFLMFSSSKADPSFLMDQTQEYWCQGVPDPNRPVAIALLRFYLHQLGDHKNVAYQITPSLADNETISRIRKLLLVIEPDGYYYQIIRDEGRRKVDAISLQGIIASRGIQAFTAGALIDGTYTKIGWDNFVKDKIVSMKKDYEEERSWVLGTSVSPGELKIDEKLRSYYFRDYQQSWWDFLKGIGVKPFNGFQDASQKLAILSDAQQSPLLLLFKAVSLNTWDDLDTLKAEELKKAESSPDDGKGPRFGVAQNFQAIHAMVTKKENQESALENYLKTLARLQVLIRTFLDANQPSGQIPGIVQEADTALQATNGLLVTFDANARQTVEPIFKQPIQQIMAILNKSTPVGTVKNERQRGLIAGGTLKEKDKNLNGATVVVLEAYSENKVLADKEIMRAQTRDGIFEFPNPINPGSFKICAAKKGDKNFFCGDVRLDRERNGQSFELSRSRSMMMFGGGKLNVILNIK
jgi:type VI secretion system protein ImpL